MLVDVGTGSGLIALTLARARSDAVVFGTDLSALAIRAARRNARALGAGSVRFRQGDLLGALPDGTAGRVSMIVSNIPSDPPTVSRHKRVPRRTLVGPEADGLGLVRRLIEESAKVSDRRRDARVDARDRADLSSNRIRAAGIPRIGGYPVRGCSIQLLHP